VRKQLVAGLLASALMAAMLPGVASAAKVTTKTDCKNGAWQDLVDENGQPFPDKAACTSYAKDGGTPAAPQTVFAIAYSNLDGTPGFGAGDVLISKLVDGNGDSVLNAGDLVVMGQYPTTFVPTGPGDFAPFGGAASATVEQVTIYPTPAVSVQSVGGQTHFWTTQDESQYYQGIGLVYDLVGWTIDCACADEIRVADISLIRGAPWGEIDDHFIDVDLNL
jgi:hypothetical protein